MSDDELEAALEKTLSGEVVKLAAEVAKLGAAIRASLPRALKWLVSSRGPDV